ncbi:MAG: phosphatidylglycerol lysyltransferase domain-containing protein [Bacteroidales bacterium]
MNRAICVAENSGVMTSFSLDEIVDCDELVFKDITLDDMQQVASYLRYSNSYSCDYTLGGIYLWIGYLGYKFAIYHNTLFIRGVAPDDRSKVAFSLPLGELPLAQGVQLVRDYCDKNGIQAQFSAIPQERLDEFMTFSPKSVQELEDWADYIYSANDLATLKGNKFSKKRNHVNKFFATYPTATISEINANNISAVRDCYHHICAGATNDTPMARYERNQVATALERLYQYPFQHLCLMFDGKVIGFTIGEIVGDTLHVHIEKVQREFSGANEALCKLFTERMLNKYQIKLVNRQDDAGDAGLRKSKLSYHPQLILKKYNCEL